MESHESDQSISPSFHLFVALPAELRFMIWRLALIPRIITLKRHSDRPCNLRSVEALLLVNREARAIFLSCYKRKFDTYGAKGIYIDFTKDTIFLAGKNAKKDLVKLMSQYTHTMSQVKYLDIAPYPWRSEFDWNRYSIQKVMPSLVMITIRFLPPFIGALRIAGLLGVEIVRWNVGLIADNMGYSNLGFRLKPARVKPRLALVLGPTQIVPERFEDHLGDPTVRFPFSIAAPSDATWERIEANLVGGAVEYNWPGRTAWRDEKWFVAEFHPCH